MKPAFFLEGKPVYLSMVDMDLRQYNMDHRSAWFIDRYGDIVRISSFDNSIVYLKASIVRRRDLKVVDPRNIEYENGDKLDNRRKNIKVKEIWQHAHAA